MSPVRRYFLACDRLDIAEAQGKPARINRLRAIVDQLGDEAGDALADERLNRPAMHGLFASLQQAFGTNNT